MIKLLHGDCLELMKDIPDNSIDMVLTDPPYGTTACKWDTVIPFNKYVQFYKGDKKTKVMYEDEFILYKIKQEYTYIEAKAVFDKECRLGIWDHLKRIIKDNGAICLFGKNPFTASLIMSNPKIYKYDWHWEKHKASNFLNAKKQPLRKTEFISVFYNKQCTYYPQGLKPYNKMRVRKSKEGSSDNFGKYGAKNFSEFTNYPNEILKFSLDTSVNSTYKAVKNKRRPHPTQKPVPLLEYLIKTYTLEGETVLDFTCGSGSTGVAAQNLNRDCILIEKEKKYYDIAKERIGNE